MSVMTIRVVTPDKLVFDGEAERVLPEELMVTLLFYITIFR